MKRHVWLLLATGLFVLSSPGAVAEGGTISIDVLTTFDYPGASSTHPMGINNVNQVVGSFADARTKGFIRAANGTFSPPLVEPNDFGLETVAAGINDSGVVSGYFTGLTASFLGFFLSGNSYTEFVVPGAQDTFVTGLNNAGDFVGYSSDAMTGKTAAFVSIGGSITSIVIPGASNSFAYGINSRDQYCGYYRAARAVHGFYLDRNGILQFPVDAPEGTTVFYGMNDRGWIVGTTTDSLGTTHGILFVPPATFTTFDYPGAKFTRFSGINKEGVIAGDESDDLFGNPTHGFLARVRLSADQD